MAINTDNFPVVKIVKEAIGKRIEEIAKEEFQEAVKRIEKRQPEAVAGVLIAVEKYMSYEKFGQTVRIEFQDLSVDNSHTPPSKSV